MIEGIPIIDLTAPALLGVAILMLLLGKLVPWTTYQEKIKEAERWREAYEAEHQARLVSDAQTTELLEVTKSTHDVLSAIFGSGIRTRRVGARDVASKE